MPAIRPARFRLNTSHPLAQGLVFAGLGENPGRYKYRDSSIFRTEPSSENATASHSWIISSELGRRAFSWNSTAEDEISFPVSVGEGFTLLAFVRWNTAANSYASWFASSYGVDATSFQMIEDEVYGGNVQLPHTALSGDRYTHVAFSSESANHTLFLDSEVDAYSSDSDALVVSAIRLGTNRGGTLWVQCDLADVMLYDRVLAHSEIRALADPSNILLDGLIEPHQSRIIFSAPAAAGTFTATAAVETGGATSASSATHTAPTFSATVAAETGGATSEATATHTAPIFTATAAVEIGGATAEATASYADAIFQGSAALEAGGATAEATASHTAPVFTASAALTVGGATSEAAATYTSPAGGSFQAAWASNISTHLGLGL